MPIRNNIQVKGGNNGYGADDFKGAGKLQDSNTIITIIPDREGDFEYRLDERAYRSDNKFYTDLPAKAPFIVLGKVFGLFR